MDLSLKIFQLLLGVTHRSILGWAVDFIDEEYCSYILLCELYIRCILLSLGR